MFKGFKIQVWLYSSGGLFIISPDYLRFGVEEVYWDHSDVQCLCSWSISGLQEGLERI